MRNFVAFFSIMLLASCSTIKQQGIEQTNWLGKNVTIYSKMPEKGTVTAERKINTSLLVPTGNESSVKTERNTETVVVVFEYLRNQIPEERGKDYYKEEILFEIPAKAFKKTYSNTHLQDVKMVFGKHCYCPGESGYFNVTSGDLKVNHKDESTYVTLTFKVPTTSDLQTIEFEVE